MKRIDDPVGPGQLVSLDLVGWDPIHDCPRREVEAFLEAGVTELAAVFIEELNEESAWPAFDRRFLDAIRAWSAYDHDSGTSVWARVKTAEKPVVVPDDWADLLPADANTSTGMHTPARSDFYGVDPALVREAAAEDEAIEVVLHEPPGDGWHRLAWLPIHGNPEWCAFYCECDLQGYRTDDGLTSMSDSSCPYKRVGAYLRALSLQGTVHGKDVAAIRRLLDRALASEWLGQQSGSGFWGSNLYLQTVSTLLDIPTTEIWPVAEQAQRDGLLSLEGAILVPHREPRTAPPGPLMAWTQNLGELDPDEFVVWWSRLDNRYQVEVVADDNAAVLSIYDHAHGDQCIHSEPTTVTADAVFGPDADDVAGWSQRAVDVVDEKRLHPPG